MQVNTWDEAFAARKAIEAFEDREIERTAVQVAARKAELAGLIGDLGGNPKLVEWAMARYAFDLKRGIGSAMTAEAGIRWNLQNLARALADVCDAFGIDPASITEDNL